MITEMDRGLFCINDVGARAAVGVAEDSAEGSTVTVEVAGESLPVGVAEVTSSCGVGVGVSVLVTLEVAEVELDELDDELDDDDVALDVALVEEELSLLH